MTTTYLQTKNMIAKTIGIFVFTLFVGLGFAARAAEGVNIVDGYAVHGYDVVAYFTKGKPTIGTDLYTTEYDGARYRFASAESRNLFLASPELYAPQYGGYCAFGTAFGRKFDGDPTAWKIVDGKLYLNLNKNVQAKWLIDPEGFIRSADNNWLIVKNIPDTQLVSSQPAGLILGAQ